MYLSFLNELLNRKRESLENEKKWLELQLSESSCSGFPFAFHSRQLGEVLLDLGMYEEAECQFKTSEEALIVLGEDPIELTRTRVGIS